MKAEDYIAYEGRVEVVDWVYAAGGKRWVRFGLANRGELDHFDKTTRRSKSKAGQRYKATLAHGELDGGTHNFDAWFMGANWSHQEGATFKVHVDEDDLFTISRLTTRVESKDHPSAAHIVLVQIDTDEKPINQRHVDNAEKIERLKGGPISKNAGMLCHDEDFQAYVKAQPGGQALLEDCEPDEAAAMFVRVTCQVESRAHLDHDADAAAAFEKMKGDFLGWCQYEGRP